MVCNCTIAQRCNKGLHPFSQLMLKYLCIFSSLVLKFQIFQEPFIDVAVGGHCLAGIDEGCVLVWAVTAHGRVCVVIQNHLLSVMSF